MRYLPENEVKVLDALKDRAEAIEVGQLAAELGVDQSPVAAASLTLAHQGFVEVREQEFPEYRLGKESSLLEGGPLPERIVAQVLAAQGGECALKDIPAHCQLSAQQVGQTLRWLQQKGWATKEGQVLKITPAGRSTAEGRCPPSADEKLLGLLRERGRATAEETRAAGIDLDEALASLANRKGFLDIRQRTSRKICLTAAGRELVAGGVAARKQVNQLTSDMLIDGTWRQMDIRPYDVRLPAAVRYPGKEHPFGRLIQRARRAFLEMGFEEVTSPYVESSFWDFDALFQPQDHPARDMQDTFYVARPAQTELPDEAIVSEVAATHEHGGRTGSLGWQYRWSRQLAAKPVLRTHTTAASIRAIAENPKGPRKVFAVGPVFRRETVDYKHLPVFHQIEGIIIDKQASLVGLLGTLAQFYRKMGIDRVTFRPGFFPYTEPSVEIFIWNDERSDWFEMGGSGIFRPEVTLPFGCTEPVLAWGLGLERLAMLLHGLSDIRELYYTHLKWLKETPLCR